MSCPGARHAADFATGFDRRPAPGSIFPAGGGGMGRCGRVFFGVAALVEAIALASPERKQDCGDQRAAAVSAATATMVPASLPSMSLPGAAGSDAGGAARRLQRLDHRAGR